VSDGASSPIVLVAVDGSPSSLRAGAYAVGLAQRQGARLVCLYVHTSSPVLPGASPVVDVAIRETKETIAADLRRLVTEGAQHAGLDAVFIERHGSPYTEIVRAATELRADSIVVGASTQAGHRVLGAVGARLVRRATWPVTVVP